MRRLFALSALLVFASSLLISGCGHFKPSPGQIKKHSEATQQNDTKS